MNRYKYFVCLAVLVNSALTVPRAQAAEPLVRRKPAPEPAPKTLIGRENNAPLCEYVGVPYNDSFLWFWYYPDTDFTCRPTTGSNTSQCTPTTEGGRPADSSYYLQRIYGAPMTWSDGTALYGVWHVGCARSPQGTYNDVVTWTHVEGSALNPGPLPPGATHVDVLLAHVDGGVVQHLRPAVVRGMVDIRAGEYKSLVQNDLTLAIQALGDNGWYDIASAPHTTTSQLQTLKVEATVPEGTDVRLEVRGKTSVNDHQGVGYDLRDARIFVETCILDANNPDTCVE